MFQQEGRFLFNEQFILMLQVEEVVTEPSQVVSAWRLIFSIWVFTRTRIATELSIVERAVKLDRMLEVDWRGIHSVPRAARGTSSSISTGSRSRRPPRHPSAVRWSARTSSCANGWNDVFIIRFQPPTKKGNGAYDDDGIVRRKKMMKCIQ